MFTGLVQSVGDVIESHPRRAAGGGGGERLQGVRLTIAAPAEWRHDAREGDSICVSGCCLTVTAVADQRLSFDVVAESLAKTKPDWWAVGSKVNLERSVRADTLMGGHIVQGHVDGVGRVVRVERDGLGEGGDYRVTIQPPAELMEFLTPKGSVCIDGVSLTIADLRVGDAANPGTLTVALIPATLAATTLASLTAGDAVNLEMDVIAKTVVHWMKHYGKGAGNREQ